MRGTALFLKEVDCDHEMKMHTIFCIGSIVYIKTRRFLLKASGRYSLSHRIREGIPNNLRRILHENVVADARSRSANLPCDSGIAVILVVKLVHQNQLFRRNSCCHGFISPESSVQAWQQVLLPDAARSSAAYRNEPSLRASIRRCIR